MLVGGYDRTGGSIYNLDFFGSILKENVTSTGSGSPVRSGRPRGGIQEGMSVAKALPVAANAIIAATRRNVCTGDHFDIAIIDKSGFREVSEQDKDKLLAQFPGRS